MITIAELLKDPAYKAFFCTVPELPAHFTPDKKPWRLMVLRKGEHHWRMKRFGTYREAFAALKKLLPKVADATINCPGLDFQPPTKVVFLKGKYRITGRGKKIQLTRTTVWKPKMPMGEYDDHHWCPYCRRPSVFRRFATHPALPSRKLGGVGVDPTLLRCTICGASENLVNLRKPETHQKWDPMAVHRPTNSMER